MQHSPGVGIAAVAIAIWLFIAIVSVAGMIYDYRKRRLALEPLRIAIEHGQQLSPEIIAKLVGREESKDEIDPRHLQIGGIITIAAGIGIALLSIFIAMTFPTRPWIVLGVGVLAVCVGVGLLIAAKSLRR